VVLIPNRVSQEAMQVIQAWFVDNTLNVKIKQVGRAGRAKRKETVKTEQLLAISIIQNTQMCQSITQFISYTLNTI
jgi:hypothetical protein